MKDFGTLIDRKRKNNMRQLLLTLFLTPCLSFAQLDYELDSVGIDESALLNLNEIKYTEYLLTGLYADSIFDLNQKKTVFLTGNYGSNLVSKSVFFNVYCKQWTASQAMPQIQIIILTKDEANEIGYELILVAWSKIFADGKARKKFINNARQAKVPNGLNDFKDK